MAALRGGGGSAVDGGGDWDVAGQSVSVEGRDFVGRDVTGQSVSVEGRDFVGRDVAGQPVSDEGRDFVGRDVAGQSPVVGAGFGGALAALARAACAAGLLGSNRGGSVPFLT